MPGFQDLAWVQVNTTYPRFYSGRNMLKRLWREFDQERSQRVVKMEVFCVCGDDVVERYHDVAEWFVVVGRTGATDLVNEIIQTKQGEGMILRATLSDEYCRMSSTDVRRALSERSEGLLRQLCPASVATYLWEQSGANLYAEP